MSESRPIKLDIATIAKSLKIDPKALNELDEAIKQSDFDVPEDLAKNLHAKFWVYKSMVSEWVTKAKRYERECKLRMSSIFATLKGLSEEKSEAAKTREAESNEEYLKATELYYSAQLFREHLDMKREDLREGHYMCKTILSSLMDDRHMSPKGSDATGDF
jgi:hypothetical protein